MSKKNLYVIWCFLYVLCGLLGFFPSPEGIWYWLLFLLSLAFFIPPFQMLHQALQRDDAKTLRLLHLLSLCSLGATLVSFILNLLCYSASAAVGNLMHILFVMVSSPMVCGQIWIVSLFLWACLLIASRKGLKKKD